MRLYFLLSTLLLLSLSCETSQKANDSITNGLYSDLEENLQHLIDSSDMITWLKYHHGKKTYRKSEVGFKIKSRTDSLIRAVWFLDAEITSRIDFHLLEKDQLAVISYKSDDIYDRDMIDYTYLMKRFDEKIPVSSQSTNLPKSRLTINLDSNSLLEPFYILHDNNEIDLSRSCRNRHRFNENMSFSTSPYCIRTNAYNVRECQLIKNGEVKDIPVIGYLSDTSNYNSDSFLVHNGVNNLSPFIFKERYNIDWTGNIEDFYFYSKN